MVDNYQRLITRVDTRCREIQTLFQPHIRCQAGCCHCCQSFGVFPVEAQAMLSELHRLPHRLREEARAAWLARRTSDACPFLWRRQCLIYRARPVICRTQGLPLLISTGDEPEIDCCPLNFRTLTELPPEAVLPLDHLNTLLATVNAVFMQQHPCGSLWPDRIDMADIWAMLPALPVLSAA